MGHLLKGYLGEKSHENSTFDSLPHWGNFRRNSAIWIVVLPRTTSIRLPRTTSIRLPRTTSIRLPFPRFRILGKTRILFLGCTCNSAIVVRVLPRTTSIRLIPQNSLPPLLKHGQLDNLEILKIF